MTKNTADIRILQQLQELQSGNSTRTYKHASGSILGTFSKGCNNSVSVNFGVSGGANCDIRCAHFGVDCYAQRSEIRPDRKQLANKLQRHQETHPAIIAGRALLEVQNMVASGVIVPWLRISTNGSLPQPETVRDSALFRSQLRSLFQFCNRSEIPVHCPVETFDKARFYRGLIGDLVTVRESCQKESRFLRARGAVSFVAGTKSQSMSERVQTARKLAKQRTKRTNRKCISCPAIEQSFAHKLAGIHWRSDRKTAQKNGAEFSTPQPQPNLKAKCGNCKACDNPNCDVVYALH